MRLFIAALLAFVMVLPAVALDEAQLLAPLPPSQPIRFRDAHPKLYRIYRKTRHVCICVKPIIDVAGSVCQVVLVFL